MTAVGTRAFFCEVDQEYCTKTMYLPGLDNLAEFGGLGGGPVFALRRLNLELIGFVKEYSPGRDAFHFSMARLIDADGRITI